MTHHVFFNFYTFKYFTIITDIICPTKFVTIVEDLLLVKKQQLRNSIILDQYQNNFTLRNGTNNL